MSVCESLLDLMQAIIGNYAVPVLEEKQVWGTSDDTRTAYLDSQVAHLMDPMVTALLPRHFCLHIHAWHKVAVQQHLHRMRQGFFATPHWKPGN